MRAAVSVLLALAVISSTVDANVVYVRKAATGSNDGSSWTNAFVELRDALPHATSADDVWVAEGTYTPSSSSASFVLDSKRVFGGLAGTETSIDQRNWATHPTILSGDVNGDDNGFGGADNATHVVTITAHSTVLDGVTVEGGYAIGQGQNGQGAGVYITGSMGVAPYTIVRNCVVRRNVAVRGAGVYVDTGYIQMRGVLIANNLAGGPGNLDGAAGLYVTPSGGMETSSCTIAGNVQTAGGPNIGSAFYDNGGNQMLISESIVWGNSVPATSGSATSDTCCIQGSTNPSDFHADPIFVDPANGDYRLQSGSPYIDRGSAYLLDRDLGGFARRIQDFSVSLTSTTWADLGAYEHPYDCNGDSIPDYIEIAQGARDLNHNGNLDECEPAGTPFCFGDGTGTACPCGNTGEHEKGCANSSGHSGHMRAVGNPSVSADTLLIHVDGLGASAPALYFQGTNLDLVGGASGVAFGDGLRCVYGSVTRLPTKISVNGSSSIGAGVPGDLPVSVMGGGGGALYYQAWYRDPVPFCTPFAYNVTNALLVQWAP